MIKLRKSKIDDGLSEKFGEWALVVGASIGLGVC